MKSTPISLLAILCLFSAALQAQTTSYTISTFAGIYANGFYGDGSAANLAALNNPIAVTLDAAGNLYIADSANNRIRKVTKSTGKISTVAGSGITAPYTGDGGSATSASLNAPYGVAVDAAGANVYIADLLNHSVHKVNSSGTISTVAGTGIFGFSGDGGTGANAQLNRPFGLALDAVGNLYIADSNNYCIRKLDASGNISTVAGTPNSSGFAGDGGPATKAKMGSPYGIAVDAAGNLYIADSGNNRIRKVSNGVITTLAGTGVKGFSGDGGAATGAQLNAPYGVSVDAAGNVFVSDYGNVRVRVIASNGMIQTLAGFAAGYGGDGGPAINATLNFPTATVSDAAGNVFIADSGNSVIRQMAPGAPAVGAGGVISASAFGAFPAVAPGSWIEIYGNNLATNVRSWAGGDFKGAAAPTALDGNAVTIGGQAAFLDYISGGQINAQVPSNVGTGAQPLVVTNADGGKATYTVTVNATEPGIYAPPSLVVGGKQYAGAVFNDGTTYVLPAGAVAGIASRAAKAGDLITFYGVGFGAVTPAIAAGQIVTVSNTLPGFQAQIGGVGATIQYAGLAPNAIGLYQFNVVVPAGVAAGDAVAVRFTLNGTAGTQTLFIAVQ
jgi:uncharacterized protein (TIGR03437 family)